MVVLLNTGGVDINASGLADPPIFQAVGRGHLGAMRLLVQQGGRLLYFLACLRPMNPDQPQAQKLVQEAIALLRPLSPCLVHPAHMWPLFVCTVYAVVDADRVFFLDQFNLLRGHSHIHLMKKSLEK